MQFARRLGLSSVAFAILGFAGVHAVQAQTLTPTSFWQFNEASGTTILDSVGTNNGYYDGGVTRITGAPGQGGALSFDNTDGMVHVGSTLAASTGVTVEALIRPTWDQSDYDEIIRKNDGGIFLLSFQNDGNGNGFANPDPIHTPQGPVLSFGLQLTTGYQELDMPLDGLDGRPTVASLLDGNWHSVDAEFDNTTGVKSLAIDGKITYSSAYALGTLCNSEAGDTIIGNAPGGGEAFSGGIDQVGIYDRALSSSEIADHYTSVQNGGTFISGAEAAPEPGALALLATAFPAIGGIAFQKRRRRLTA